MINFDYQFTVNASPQEVFDLFTDPTRGTEWRESAVSAEWTSEPPHGVGSVSYTHLTLPTTPYV